MRKCLPLTALKQQFVDDAIAFEWVRRALLIAETERKMVEGTTPPEAWGYATFNNTKFWVNTNYSALEVRIQAQLAQHNYLHERMNGSPTGRTSNVRPWSRDTEARSLQERFLELYPKVDAHFTKEWWSGHMYRATNHLECVAGCVLCTKKKKYHIRWLPYVPDLRKLVHNYDDLFEQ